MSEKDNRGKVFSIASSFAFEVITIVGIFTLTGYFLDKWLNTVFVFTLIFILLGVFSGIYNLIRKVNKVGSKDGKK